MPKEKLIERFFELAKEINMLLSEDILNLVSGYDEGVISVLEAEILLTISKGETSVSDILSAHDIKSSALTSILESLSRLKFIERYKKVDKRKVYFKMLDRGEHFCNYFNAGKQKLFNDISSKIIEQDLIKSISSLMKVRDELNYQKHTYHGKILYIGKIGEEE